MTHANRPEVVMEANKTTAERGGEGTPYTGGHCPKGEICFLACSALKGTEDYNLNLKENSPFIPIK